MTSRWTININLGFQNAYFCWKAPGNGAWKFDFLFKESDLPVTFYRQASGQKDSFHIPHNLSIHLFKGHNFRSCLFVPDPSLLCA